ncbi:MAG: murein L,D-transpeptidase [Bacteroidota bacterium]
MRSWLKWILILGLAACKSNGTEHESFVQRDFDHSMMQEIAGNFSNRQDVQLDSLAIVQFIGTYHHFKEFSKDIFRFYANRNFTMAWFDSTGIIEQASLLYNRIVKMKEDGLTLDIPYMDEYIAVMSSPEEANKVFTELMQTAQYLHFAQKLFSGLTEAESTSLEWFIPRKKTDYIELLDQLLSRDTVSIQQHFFPQYDLLKNHLSIYRQIENDGGWDSIPLPKKSIQYGDAGKIVTAIKKRLFTTGEFAKTDTAPDFNLALESAVKQFQQTHGLKTDGIVNRTTLLELNVAVKDRIEQIILNMERCRWLPNQTQTNYLLVNIPQYKLYVFNKDGLSFACKAVVGKETNRTVIFKGDMKYVVFSPYWNVPPNIMRKEILPAMKRNSQYLSENNMEWHGNIIRQVPGPWNALGGVKFVFPNGYDIYLHDTPSKLLFNESTRTFSHGCIRISEPKKLAMFLLADQEQWTAESIESAMSSRIEKFVPLKKPIPVYVVYLTAFVDADGLLNFSKDVYGRDVQLKRMILN